MLLQFDLPVCLILLILAQMHHNVGNYEKAASTLDGVLIVDPST